MKTLVFALATLTAGLGATTARAEFFSPSVVPGAVIGGIAGAVLGNNSGNHRGSDGAVIGAVAGGLIGAAIDQDRNAAYCPPEPVTYGPPTVVYREPAARVVYVPAPPRRVVYVEPRHEVVVRHYDVHARYEPRHDRDDRRDHDRR